MIESHERSEELFVQALALPEGERQRFLDQACGADRGLRQELDALLLGHATGEFLESAVAAELKDRLIGTRIDRYKLLERIGEGGSGTVYLAEQEEPIRRRMREVQPPTPSQRLAAREPKPAPPAAPATPPRADVRASP